MHMLYVSSQTS